MTSFFHRLRSALVALCFVSITTTTASAVTISGLYGAESGRITDVFGSIVDPSTIIIPSDANLDFVGIGTAYNRVIGPSATDLLTFNTAADAVSINFWMSAATQTTTPVSVRLIGYDGGFVGGTTLFDTILSTSAVMPIVSFGLTNQIMTSGLFSVKTVGLTTGLAANIDSQVSYYEVSSPTAVPLPASLPLLLIGLLCLGAVRSRSV